MSICCVFVKCKWISIARHYRRKKFNIEIQKYLLIFYYISFHYKYSVRLWHTRNFIWIIKVILSFLLWSNIMYLYSKVNNTLWDNQGAKLLKYDTTILSQILILKYRFISFLRYLNLSYQCFHIEYLRCIQIFK